MLSQMLSPDAKNELVKKYDCAKVFEHVHYAPNCPFNEEDFYQDRSDKPAGFKRNNGLYESVKKNLMYCTELDAKVHNVLRFIYSANNAIKEVTGTQSTVLVHLP